MRLGVGDSFGEMSLITVRTLSAVEWSGVEWSGVEWSGVEWSGVEWSGVEWWTGKEAWADDNDVRP
jgi:hypothetical protein